MIENVAPGNTQVFNNALRELLCKTVKAECVAMHDHYAYLAACAFGKVIYDENSYIQYRQHEQNVIGMGKGVLNQLRENIKVVFSGKIRRISRQLDLFYTIYGAGLKKDYSVEIEYFLAGNFIGRLKYFFHKKAFPL
jgi:hypothetical protein